MSKPNTEIPVVIGMGIPVSDYIINLEHMPEPNADCRVLLHSWQQGGKASTAMAALGRLGVPCAFVGVVGGDAEGAAHREDLRFHHVNTTHMVVDPAFETAYNVVLSNAAGGGRSILHSRRNVRGLRPEDLDEAFLKSARFLLVEAAGEAERTAIRWVHEAGGQVVCDADRYSATLEEVTPQIDVMIASEHYYLHRYPELSPQQACERIAGLGPHTVIITLGERGCVGVWPGGSFTLPAFRVEAVDTTGAGDTFHGAYCYGLAHSWGAPDCARFASATAALKCLAVGGRAGLPTEQAVHKFLDSGAIDTADLEERVRHYARYPEILGQNQVSICKGVEQ